MVRGGSVGYYEKKAWMTALIREQELPDDMRGCFRVIGEVYAHGRPDLTLALCRAVLMTRPGVLPEPSPPSAPADATDVPMPQRARQAILAALAHASRPAAASAGLGAWTCIRLCLSPS